MYIPESNYLNMLYKLNRKTHYATCGAMCFLMKNYGLSGCARMQNARMQNAKLKGRFAPIIEHEEITP